MENTPIRILHIVPNMHRAGMETLIMNIFRTINRDKIVFDFLVHYSEKFDYDDEIERLGGKIYHLTVRNDNNFRKYKKDLYCFFREHPEYKVIHGHMESFGFIYSKIAKKCGVKCIIGHSHNASYEPGIKGLVKNFMNKFWKKHLDYCFACSTEAGKYMFKGKQFTLIKNGIISSNFTFSKIKRDEIRSKYGIDDNTVVIGHIGRMEKQKNQSFLIDIFKEYCCMNPNSRLIIIGDGHLKEDLIMKVSALNLTSKVIFTGVVPNCNEFYSAFDLFLLPSLFEGLPVVGIEAQCSGLPLLFSNVISSETNITGNIFYESLDNKASIWAKKINDILNTFNRTDCTKIVQQNGFDINFTCDFLERFYLEHYYE